MQIVEALAAQFWPSTASAATWQELQVLSVSVCWALLPVWQVAIARFLDWLQFILRAAIGNFSTRRMC